MSSPTTVTSLDYASLEHRWSKLPPPPGFSEVSTKGKGSGSKSSAVATSASASSSSAKSAAEALSSHEALKKRKAWDFAVSPLKSLPMQAFMLYMSGGGVQIFSMGIVAMLLLSPFKNLSTVNAVFAPFAPGPPSSPAAKSFTTLLLQKLVYLACNIVTLALGLWKCRSMGLLPTGTGDWLAFETRRPAPEISLF